MIFKDFNDEDVEKIFHALRANFKVIDIIDGNFNFDSIDIELLPLDFDSQEHNLKLAIRRVASRCLVII